MQKRIVQILDQRLKSLVLKRFRPDGAFVTVIPLKLILMGWKNRVRKLDDGLRSAVQAKGAECFAFGGIRATA